MVVIVWYLYLQLPVQSVPITIKVVSSNPTHGKVCSIQHYVIKSDSDLRQMVVSSSNKTYHHYINEILLKVAFNVITPNPTPLQINVLETLEKVYRRFLINFSIMLNYLPLLWPYRVSNHHQVHKKVPSICSFYSLRIIDIKHFIFFLFLAVNKVYRVSKQWGRIHTIFLKMLWQ
jgi:hypothetical protein